MIAVDDYIHPLDKIMAEKILQIKPLAAWLDQAYENGLDQVGDYVYSASLPEIGDRVLLDMMERACHKFGIPPAMLYRQRSYEYDVVCVGYRKPIVILPAILLEQGDMAIIEGRLHAAAASFAAKHSKLAFLLWAAKNIVGSDSLPVIGQTASLLLYEWNRARFLTLDRAFLLATSDLVLTLKNILYGVVPPAWLENFHPGESDDGFLKQTERYLKVDTPTQLAGKALGYFTDFAWLPKRYDEIRKFQRERNRDGEW